MSSLYEINQSLLDFLENGYNTDCIDIETGEILSDKASEILNDLQIDRNTKIENIGLYIKNLEADCDAIKQEEASLKQRRQSKENKIANLKDYLANSMQLFKEQKFETAKIALSFRKSISVEVSDVRNLPVDYIKEKVEYVADKMQLKKDLQNGKEICGAVLVEKQNLQIK